jgi:hypothetical protein
MPPDQIVYAGSYPLLFDPPDDAPAGALADLLTEALAANVAAHGSAPIITVVPGLGIFAAGDTWKESDTARHVYLDCLRVAEAADAISGARPGAPTSYLVLILAGLIAPTTRSAMGLLVSLRTNQDTPQRPFGALAA